MEYPADDDDNNKDHDAGSVFFARRATIITNDEDMEDIDKDRIDDNKEYKGDWTNELSQEDGLEESEEEYESRSKSQSSDAQGAQGEEEYEQHPDTEACDEEEPQDDDASVGENVVAESEGNNMRPKRANAGMGVTRLEPSMKGKSYQDTKVQLVQKGATNNNDKCEWFVKLRDKAVNACFTQMSTRKGIEQYGKLAVAAMLKSINSSTT